MKPAMTVSPRMLLSFCQLSFNTWGSVLNLLSVRNIAKQEAHGYLEVKTNGGHGIGLEAGEAKAADDGRTISIESTLRTVIAKRDEAMNPKTPVQELFGRDRPC